MILEDKIILFSNLGDFLLNEKSADELKNWASAAKNQNGWFTEDNVLLALQNIAENYLNKAALDDFSKDINPIEAKKIGIIAAGNIPLVGFHDLLCVLLSGHQALIKLSSSDNALMTRIINKLIALNPAIETEIELAERLNAADAYIATGSDNSARYFEYYFGKKPCIIRKNRSSIAVLTGKESSSDIRNLGNDIFQYFGLGCRNVSKLFIPKDYKIDDFFEPIEYWNTIHIHHKYSNNYDYNKSIYLINGNKHFDNGFLMLKPDEALVSPLSVVFYEEYENDSDLQSKLAKHGGKLQCVVGLDYLPFGQSQTPMLSDFADDVNTLEFLAALK